MRETTVAGFHGSGKKNRLDTFSSPPFVPTVDTVQRNAFFWYDEVLPLKALSGEKV